MKMSLSRVHDIMRESFSSQLQLWLLVFVVFMIALWSVWFNVFFESDIAEATAPSLPATVVSNLNGVHNVEALTAGGDYYIAFSSSTGANYGVFIISSTDGDTWTSPVSAGISASANSNGSAAFDFKYNSRANYFMLAYKDSSGNNIRFTTSSDANTWSSAQIIDSSAEVSSEVYIAFSTSSDFIATVFEMNGEMVSATSTDGSVWATSTIDSVLQTFNSNESIYYAKPLGVHVHGSSGQEIIQTVYDIASSSFGYEVIYASSTDFGDTWTTSTVSGVIPGSGQLTNLKDVASANFDSQDLPGVVYAELTEYSLVSSPFPVTSTIVFAGRSSGGVWTTSTILSPVFQSITGGDLLPRASALDFYNTNTPVVLFEGSSKYPTFSVNTSTWVNSVIENDAVAVGSDVSIVHDGCVTLLSYATSSTIRIATVALPDSSLCPTITSVSPADGSSTVPADAFVHSVLSKSLDASSVTTSTVLLQANTGNTQNGDPTGENLCLSTDLTTTTNPGDHIICEHLSDFQPLATSTWYTFSITRGVKTSSGVPVPAQLSYSFQTGNISFDSNNTPPFVMNSWPAMGSNDFPINGNLTIGFPMGQEGLMSTSGAGSVTSANNVILQQASGGAPTGSAIATTLTWNSDTRKLTINPDANLSAQTNYILSVKKTITNQNNVALNGGMIDYLLSFKTSASSDSSSPAIQSMFPASSSVDIALDIPDITVFFSKTMDDSTITSSSVSLYYDVNTDNVLDVGEKLSSASSTLNYDGFQKSLHIGLKTILQQNGRYCIVLSTSITDNLGNALPASTRCFTTVNQAFSAVAPVLMFADADNFKMWIEYDRPVNPTDVVNKNNYTIESPVGTSISLTGATLTYRPEARAVEITNIGLTPDQQFKATVTGVRDVSGTETIVANGTTNIAQGIVLSSSQTGGFVGGFDTQNFDQKDFSTFWENPERCSSRTLITSATTTMECEFPVPASLAVGSKFILSLPTGFNIGSTSVVPTSTSFINNDINGPSANVPYIGTVSNNTSANTITLTTAGGTISSGDHIRFELQNIVNAATAGEKTITIVVKDDSGIKRGQTISAAPFVLGDGGNRTISGTVCKGSGATALCDVAGSDTAVSGATIFCDSFGGFGASTVMAGHQETTTDANGDWSIANFSDGEYGCGIVPDPTVFNNMSGGADFKKIFLLGGNKTSVDFRFTDLSSSGKTLTVTVASSNALANEAVDIFCHAGSSDQNFSTPVIKQVSLDADGAGSTSMKLQPGKTYECGLGPHIEFAAFTSGGPPPMPDFNFMPPKPQQVNVPSDANPTAVTFSLEVAGETIIGTVKDGSANGIANVFVHAAPMGCFDASTGASKDCFGGFTQTKSDGTFTLNVAPGSYEVGADAPGMPPGEPTQVTVTAGSSVSGIVLNMLKSSVTIAGSVKDESGNGIKYAQVSAQSVSSGDTCSSFAPIGGFRDSPTDSSGNYTLYVSNGTWRVEAYSPSYGRVDCKVITISDSTSVTGQTLQATAGDFVTISGTGKAGAFVSAFGQNGGNQTSVDNDGNYSIKVKSGTYTLDCFAHGVGPCGFSAGVDASSDVTVNFGTSVDTGTVNVTITGISDAFVDVRNSSGKGSGTGQSSSGVYTIVVPVGSYTVRAGGPRYGELCSGQTVTVTSGGTHAITCAPPSTLYTVSGRVTDGSNNIAGATVKFINNSTKESFITTSNGKTSSNENFSFSNVSNGTYTIVTSKAGYEQGSGTVTVSGANVSVSSAITMTQASGSNGTSITATVQASGSNYAGSAKVIATKSGKVVAIDIDKTTGQATLPLTNGTWTVKAVGDNGKTSSETSVVVSGGSLSGSAPTLSLANSISGFSPSNESKTMSPKGGALITSDSVGGLEVNIPASTLHTSDSNTGKMEIKTDPTIASVTPGTGLSFVGSTGYDITPKDSSGNTLGKTLYGDAVTITIPYTDADVTAAGVDEDKLVVASLNINGEFETFPTVVDTDNNLLIAQVTHFSSFGVIGGTTAVASSPSSPSSPSSGGGGSSPSSAPNTISFVIQNDDVKTTTREVTLKFDVSNAVQMAISNENSFEDISFETFVSTTTWTLTEGNGMKRVYVKLRSASGGIATAQDTIELVDQSFDQVEQETVVPCALTPGSAYKYVNNPSVYYISNDCQRRPFRKSTYYFSYFKSWNDVETIDKQKLEEIEIDPRGVMPWGPLYDPKYGAVVKTIDDPKVYLLLNNKKYWIMSEDVFSGLNYQGSWVEDVSQELLAKYPLGSEITDTEEHPEHSIVKYMTDSKVYRIEYNDEQQKIRRHIKNAHAFDALGFRWDRIIIIPDTEQYTEGVELE